MQIVDASNISGNPYLETEHSRKDVAIFCKRIKFEEFGLEVWLFGWSFRANTSNTAMKEEKFPNTQGRRPFSDPRQTVLLLYISSSLSGFLFFPVISVDLREKLHPFLPAFSEFPLKLRYSRNYSSSLTKMQFVTDAIKVHDKGMLLISWLQLTRRGELIMTCKISLWASLDTARGTFISILSAYY